MDSSAYEYTRAITVEEPADHEVLAAAVSYARSLSNRRDRAAMDLLANKVFDAALPKFCEDEQSCLILYGGDLNLAARSVRLYANASYRDIGSQLCPVERELRIRAFDLLDEFVDLGVIDPT